MKKIEEELKTAAKREEALQKLIDAELDAEGSRRLFNCR
jgi:cell division protein FtsW